MTLHEMRVYIANRMQAAGVRHDYTIEQFNVDIQKNSLLLFKQRTGLPEQYTPGSPVPSQIPELTTKMSIDLAPFTVSMGEDGVAGLSLASGLAAWPTGMYYPLAAANGNTDIDIVTNKEYNRRMSSYLEAPDINFPILRILATKIQVAPSTISQIKFTYYRYPVKPVYGIKIENGVNVYDSATTTELEWNLTCRLDILWMILSDIGITVKRNDLITVAENTKQRGV